MARNFTVGTLVTRAQQRADMEGTGGTEDFIETAEWKGYLSTAYAELYSILVASGMRYFEDVDSVATTGAAAYALPADYLSTIGVDYVVDAAGHRRSLCELMAQERNAFRGATGSSSARAYAIVGAGATPLELYPTPPSGQTYEHVYVPQPADLSSEADGTNVDVVTPDGEAFIVWYMAVLARDKEEEDTSRAVAERERARARLEEWATLRALNNPRRHIVAEELGGYDDGDWRSHY